MPVITMNGNLFRSASHTLVNAVNCVGVMDKGIALQFRNRYPEMYSQYVEICKQGQLDIGKLWIYRGSELPWILNFPTKKHWRDKSHYKDINLGLHKFMKTYKQEGIQSAAFPLLGTLNGELDSEVVEAIMRSYLEECTIRIEIWHYVPEIDF